MAGRPRKTWTADEAEQFRKLCRLLPTKKEAAGYFGIDVRTLDKLIAESFPETPTWDEAFEEFGAEGRLSLRRAQFQAAMDGSVPMLIFLGKNYLGQSDAGAREEKPKAGSPKMAAVVGSSHFAKQAHQRAANG